MKTILKHWMSCLPDSVIDAEIDVDRRRVTLQLDHFDSQLIATFVTSTLLEEGVVAFRDDAAVKGVGQLIPPAPFQLGIFFGGFEHAAQVVRLVDGQVTVWLEKPSEVRKRRLKAAASRALQLLHEAGWQAIVIDDVANDTITPDSKAEVRIDDRERTISGDEFRRLRDLIEAETSYDAFVERASSFVAGAFEDMLRMPHLVWDAERRSVAEAPGHDFVSDAARYEAWKRVHKAVDERFDVRNSTLAAVINICFDNRGDLPDKWRSRMADEVQEEALDFLVHEVRRVREAPGVVQRRDRDRQGKLALAEDSDASSRDEVLRRGTVSRLNQGANFGYVDDDDGVHCYIFVFGHAIKHSDARQLSVGARVRFRFEEGGRVSELQLA
jgi:CspA family cold shock protein